jgi:hypothetical protein
LSFVVVIPVFHIFSLFLASVFPSRSCKHYTATP